MANVSSSNGLEKYPKLRFKGFSEPWEHIKLAKITGYYTTAVHRWCRSGKLKALRSQPRTWISKKSLYAFLLSDDYNNIAQKSENHRMDIADIFKKIHHGG